MVARIVPLPGADTEGLRERLAEALAAEDEATLAQILQGARLQLQEAIEGELHRLIGELVLEVSAQADLAEKVRRAVALGASLLDSLPPRRIQQQLADPDQFTRRSQAACSGLVTFLAGELNRGLEADGRGGLPPPVARRWVEDGVEHLRLARQRARDDGVDRTSELAGWLTGQLQGGPGSDLTRA